MNASSSSSAAEIGAALTTLGAATLGESGGRAMRSRLRAAWPGARLAAPAYPVRCAPGDNLAVHVAVTTAPGGSVLVVDVGDVFELGYWGEVLTTAAEARGVVGLVIDGGVRDVAALEAHGFPVFSTDIALRGATKQEPGVVGETAVVGGIEVGLGDWIVGDRDGVTVVPAATLDAVMTAGRVREAKEERMFSELRDGKTTVELLDLDPSPGPGRQREIDVKVLVATDGSDLSVTAAHRAFEVLGIPTDVTVLAVLSEIPGDDAGGIEGSAQSARDERQEWEQESTAAQEALRATLAEVHGANVVTRVEVGDAGPMIVWVAEQIAADVVVVGSHGRGALKRLVSGSVSEHVVHHSPCPVLLVRNAASAH